MPDSPETLRDGRYAVIRVLGHGGQARTLEGVDKQRGAPVVIKQFVVRGAKSWKEVELAEREANVLSAIRHPSIQRYVDHFEEGGELYLVTERIEGDSLAELVKRGTRFTEDDVIAFLRAASEALDYLHTSSPPIVHRDIKPSNVIRRPDGSFAFIDFGSVRDRLKPEGGSTVVGTFGYMAPEQFQGRAMPASDVYAVGATALVLLTGTEPEKLPHKGLGIDVPAALRGTRTGSALVRALASMLEPDPDRRADRVARVLGELGRKGASSSGRRDDEPRSRENESKRERHDRKREEHARRRAERAERRAERGLARRDHRHERGVPWPLLFVLEVAFGLAEIAVMFTLRVLVPLVLILLSIVFGHALRDAARRVAGTSDGVRDWFRGTRQMLRGEIHALGAGPDEPARLAERADAAKRLRVATATDDDAAAEEEAAADEAAARKQRG